MNLETYLKRRQELGQRPEKLRRLCLTCLQPDFSCYCAHVERFDSKIEFVILIHPIEVRRRIATGRMSSLCLANSHLIPGQDYSEDARLNSLLANPDYYPVMLFPGPKSTNLTPLSEAERSALFPKDKKLAVLVIDGTWNTARKTVFRSRNLQSIPRICFTPGTPSNFRVRKQPAPECYSTLEAIHKTIELIGPGRGFDLAAREHDKLLRVFDKMVEQQLRFIENSPTRFWRRRSRTN